MIKIKNISDLIEGKQYNMISKNFNNAQNKINCICLDFTGINRQIAYFCFTDRVKKIPSKAEFIQSIKNNIGMPFTFALWDYEIKTNTELIYKI